MKKPNRKRKYFWTSVIALLILSSFASDVLASGFLLKIGDQTPGTDILVHPSAPGLSDPDSEMPDISNSTNASEESEGSVSSESSGNSDLAIESSAGVWFDEATVDIFKAAYNENGEITVKSAYGDKVIAPGTSNSYHFDIKNTGDIPIYYFFKTEALLRFTVGGETVTVPITACFHDQNGNYLLRTTDSFEEMSKLNGIQGKYIGNVIKKIRIM